MKSSVEQPEPAKKCLQAHSADERPALGATDEAHIFAQLKDEIVRLLEANHDRNVVARALMATFDHVIEDWPASYEEPMRVFVSFGEMVDLLDEKENPDRSARRKASMIAYLIQVAFPRLRATYPVGPPSLDKAVKAMTKQVLERLCDQIEMEMHEQGSAKVEEALVWETGRLADLLRRLRSDAEAPLWHVFAVCSVLGMAGASLMMAWVIEIATGGGSN